MKRFKITLPILALLAAVPAYAHPGHIADTHTVAGLVHVFSGWDYGLAMLALALWLGPKETRRTLFACLVALTKKVRVRVRGPKS